MAIDTDKLSKRQIAAVAAAFLIALFLAIRTETGVFHLVAMYAIAVGLPTLIALVVVNAAIVIGGLSNKKVMRIIKPIETIAFYVGFLSVAVAFGSILWMESKNAAFIYIAGIVFWLLFAFFLIIYWVIIDNSSSDK